MRKEFLEEIEKFKNWSKNFDDLPEQERIGEWELLYEDFPKIQDLSKEFISKKNYKDCNSEEIKLILYLIARDNECEWIINEIIKQPNSLELLAKMSFRYGEPNAKWQITKRLDKVPDRQVAISLLERFLKDDNEYVRRRALMKYAEIGGTEIDKFCKMAWDRPDEEQEYSRMAVLYSLNYVHSPSLENYLVLAKNDGRKYLVEYAEEIKRGNKI